jgi:putative endonuclease
VAAELTSKDRGDAAEAQALAHLQAHGLVPVARNYRLALGPGRHGGEIDLILRDRDGTLVFVEVRSLRRAEPGRAAQSIGAAKRARIVRAARHYLARLPQWPPCRFDVVTIEAGRVEWLQAAFDAS